VQLARVDQLNLPGGLFITNKYDAVARQTLTELMNLSGSDFDSYAYKYNRANQRTNVVRFAGDYANYTYDNAGELIAVSAFSPNGLTNRVQEGVNYTYDAAGNLSSKTFPGSTTGQIAYKVNALNEITNGLMGGPNGLGAWTAMTAVAGWASPSATNVTVNGGPTLLYQDKTYATNAVFVSNGINTFAAVKGSVNEIVMFNEEHHRPASNTYDILIN
jgi:YD repeat-containing protein